ncbi:hypothetical protein Deipr_2393 (plasmid) [Deinococcus proteolyticus MRP]|uniref:Uncharacterized protein n=1 Tax=Deinococcus proteolyticus (strain ATCC 35074 / DSM 20540 / JCM 6276 / NBRC 101906 / NCIMB 13154 / VKM Ac-1939 / CCM 2703 / MRP) TaxID=693977 RepID=F0RQF8_DEIPM|nr:hypothetical protein [Deinococcus proteolyticus]ADY27517.1 hypothetical protein Deipr_2393 [Deinococcus proteolyticus MRP]
MSYKNALCRLSHQIETEAAEPEQLVGLSQTDMDVLIGLIEEQIERSSDPDEHLVLDFLRLQLRPLEP